MNLPYPGPTWADGPFALPRPVSLPVFKSPLPNTTAQYEFTQKFQQFKNNFSPLALNTKHPNYPTYVLVAESEEHDIGGGVVEWERTYSQVPATYNDYETFAYSFIGITTVTGVNVPVVQGRNRFSERVTSRIQYDFFLAGQTFTPGSDTYSAGTADSNASSLGLGTVAAPIDLPGNIAKIFGFLYVNQAYDSTAHLWLGGVYFPCDFILTYTLPTVAQYQAMIEDAIQNGWNSTVSKQYFTKISAGQMIVNPATGTPSPNSVLGGQIAAEDSQIRRYKGNIWMRMTRYILAQ